jgi:hypothetical protein
MRTSIIVLYVQLLIQVFTGWIDKEYIYNMLYTMQNIDDLCSSVYSRGEGSCFPSHGTVHCATHLWKHRQFVSVDVFQRRRGLFPFP